MAVGRNVLADAGYGRTTAVPQLSEALRGVATRVGAKFLDLSRATENREACGKGDNPAGEWQRRLTVDPYALVSGGLDAIGLHLAQQSFHPNAAVDLHETSGFYFFVSWSAPTPGSPDRYDRAPEFAPARIDAQLLHPESHIVEQVSLSRFTDPDRAHRLKH